MDYGQKYSPVDRIAGQEKENIRPPVSGALDPGDPPSLLWSFRLRQGFGGQVGGASGPG